MLLYCPPTSTNISYCFYFSVRFSIYEFLISKFLQVCRPIVGLVLLPWVKFVICVLHVADVFGPLPSFRAAQVRYGGQATLVYPMGARHS